MAYIPWVRNPNNFILPFICQPTSNNIRQIIEFNLKIPTQLKTIRELNIILIEYHNLVCGIWYILKNHYIHCIKEIPGNQQDKIQ